VPGFIDSVSTCARSSSSVICSGVALGLVTGTCWMLFCLQNSLLASGVKYCFLLM
jgi:hypothetical protein